MALRRGPDAVVGSRYQDEFIVFQPSGRVLRFAVANTRPGAKTPTPDAPDANGDGQPDLSMLRPGNYTAKGDWFFGTKIQYEKDLPAWRVVSAGYADAALAWRDTNHDGFFSDVEQRASERRGDVMLYSRVHFSYEPTGSPIRGGRTGYGVASNGCPTVPLSDWPEFIAAVGGRSADFGYSIVDTGEDAPRR